MQSKGGSKTLHTLFLKKSYSKYMHSMHARSKERRFECQLSCIRIQERSGKGCSIYFMKVIIEWLTVNLNNK